MLRPCAGKPEMERQKKNPSVSAFFSPEKVQQAPPRQHAAPQRCAVAPSRRQRPRRPSPPQRPRLGLSHCFLFAPTHAALASGDRDSRGSSAAGAAPRAPTSSSSSAPQTPRARRPLDPPSTCPHTAFDAPASPSGSRSASPPQRAVPCTAHRSHKTSRGTPHLRRNCPRAAPCPNIAPGRMYVTGLSSHARVHTGVSLMPWQLSSTTKVERDAACTSRGAIAGRKLGVSVHRPTALLLPGTEAGIWDFCGV